MRGAIGDGETGGFFKAHPIRNGRKACGGDANPFGKRAGNASPKDAGSGGWASGLRPQAFDDPGKFHAGNIGHRWADLILPFDHQQIGEVQTNGRDSHH